MAKSIFIFVLLLLCNTVHAQQKLIGYRHNTYSNSVWLGIDSMLFDYNSAGDTLWHFAIKGDSNNGWKNNFRYTFNWDANHKRTYQLREKPNGTGGWVNDNQYFYTYNSSGYLTEVLYQVWNGGWQNTGHLVFSGYNAFGKPSNVLTESWNGATWIPVASNDKSYVNGEYLLQYDSYFYWDAISSSWKKINRKYYTYLQDSISSIQLSLPDTIGNWKGSTKEVRTYNLTTMQMTYKTNQVFDTAQNISDVNRYKYTYSPTSKISLTEYQLPSGTLWSSVNRTNYVYDANDSLSMQFSEVNTGVWENDKRTDYTLQSGKIIVEQNYDGAGSTWVESYKVNNTFDQNSLKIYSLWSNYNGATYLPVKEEYFYYNTNPLNTSSIVMRDVNIYPNPTQDAFYVEGLATETRQAWIALYDHMGRIRMEIQQALELGNNVIRIPVVNLPDGLYLLRINGHETKVVVVKHG